MQPLNEVVPGYSITLLVWKEPVPDYISGFPPEWFDLYLYKNPPSHHHHHHPILLWTKHQVLQASGCGGTGGSTGRRKGGSPDRWGFRGINPAGWDGQKPKWWVVEFSKGSESNALKMPETFRFRNYGKICHQNNLLFLMCLWWSNPKHQCYIWGWGLCRCSIATWKCGTWSSRSHPFQLNN